MILFYWNILILNYYFIKQQVDKYNENIWELNVVNDELVYY